MLLPGPVFRVAQKYLVGDCRIRDGSSDNVQTCTSRDSILNEQNRRSLAPIRSVKDSLWCRENNKKVFKCEPKGV